MEKKKTDVLQPVDDSVRRQAKALIATARHAALGTVDAETGAPFVSRIAIATQADGSPGFLISALAAHHGNLVRDPRCALLVGEPGKGDPLAHPRMTLMGRAALLAGHELASFSARYRSRNPKSKLYETLPDFSYWGFRAERISLNGGFGKAYALSPADIAIRLDGAPDWGEFEADLVARVAALENDMAHRLSRLVADLEPGWKIACIDMEGADLVRGDAVRRAWFDASISSRADIATLLS